MKKLLLLGVLGGLTTALGACSSSGDGDAASGGVPSVGLLTFDLPSDADIANLPAEAQTIINEFKALNESLTEPTSAQTGTAVYSGDGGLAIQNGSDFGAIVTGDVTLNVDFDASTVSGSMSKLTGEEDGNAIPPISGSILFQNGTITGNEYTGNVGGILSVGGENYNISGSSAGAFGGATGATTIGSFDGLVENPDGSFDDYSGVYTATR